MSGNRRKLRLNTVTVDVGCGSCRRPRLSSIFNRKPKSKTPSTCHEKQIPYYSSSSSCWHKVDPHYYGGDYFTTTTTTTTTATTSTFTTFTDTPPCDEYSDTESDMMSLRAVQGFGRIGCESVAVEKDSDDPYLDFRRSMLQMIIEKELYSKDDLRQLLNCFLQLNSPDHHGVIVRAFTEIWNN